MAGILGRAAGWVASWFKSNKAAVDSHLDPSTYFAQSEVWFPVTSSNVHSISYLEGENGRYKELRVRFLKKGTTDAGSEYRYFPVEPSLFLSMLGSASKGKFVWANIRNNSALTCKQVW